MEKNKSAPTNFIKKIWNGLEIFFNPILENTVLSAIGNINSGRFTCMHDVYTGGYIKKDDNKYNSNSSIYCKCNDLHPLLALSSRTNDLYEICKDGKIIIPAFNIDEITEDWCIKYINLRYKYDDAELKMYSFANIDYKEAYKFWLKMRNNLIAEDADYCGLKLDIKYDPDFIILEGVNKYLKEKNSHSEIIKAVKEGEVKRTEWIRYLRKYDDVKDLYDFKESVETIIEKYKFGHFIYTLAKEYELAYTDAKQKTDIESTSESKEDRKFNSKKSK